MTSHDLDDLHDYPVVCPLCGEVYPNDTELFFHDCPEWARERRHALPTLKSHRRIIEWFRTAPDSPFKRLILRTMPHALPDVEEPELLDLLIKLGPKWCYKFERKLVKRGLIEDDTRSPRDKIRKQYDLEVEEEEKRENGGRPV